MRIGIRQQLAALVLVTALIPLIVLAVVTWVNNRNFVVNVTSQELTLTASLKAAQISSDLLLIQATCATIVTRILLQQALKEFYRGNKTAANWDEASSDILGALASGGFSSLLQMTVFSRNTTSTAPDSNVLIRETAASPGIELPDTINCTNVTLGQDRSNCSYPVALYPNITYTTTSERDPMDPNVNATAVNAYQDFPLSTSSALLLGPLQINSSYALVSLTLPIVDNLNSTIVLAFMTVVAAASSLIAITQSPEGLATTGITLLVGPDRHENQFWSPQRPATANYTPPLGAVESAPVQYVFPPYTFGKTDRHQQYNYKYASLVYILIFA
jgi:osomolarity two-component system sensor histidine kinase SLN1